MFTPYTVLYVLVCLLVCVTPPGKNEKLPEISYTHSPRPYLKAFFVFFGKETLKAASIKKPPRLVEFPHISPIALFFHIETRMWNCGSIP